MNGAATSVILSGAPSGADSRGTGWWGIGDRGPGAAPSILMKMLSLMGVGNQGLFVGVAKSDKLLRLPCGDGLGQLALGIGNPLPFAPLRQGLPKVHLWEPFA